MTENIKCPNCGSENIEQVDNEDGKLCTDCICLWNESKRKPANAWIDCNERLPEPYIDVLIYADSGDYSAIGYIDGMDSWWMRGVSGREYNKEGYARNLIFTHWQPLPEPPATGKDGE